MKYSYLIALVASLVCMTAIDRRFSLAFFYDAWRSLVTLTIAVIIFIIWDAAGIMLDIFYSPGTPYATGWYLAPHFPIEELFFLIFLCYFSLIVYRLVERRWQHI